MSARDDYPLHPFASGSTGRQWERMCDEIDQLRGALDAQIAIGADLARVAFDDRIQQLEGLLQECREWMDHVKQLGYDRVDPTLRATLDHHLGAKT